MRVLVIDVGGSHVKFRTPEQADPVRLPSGRGMGASAMCDAVAGATLGWSFDAVTIGYPGPVADGRPIEEPKNLAPGWVGFDFESRFGKPVKLVNDAAMQALGSYEGGRMLFLGLGTGLGTALILEKAVAPMELAHLPYRKGRTFEDYLGRRGLDRLGPKKWRKCVADVAARLKNALLADYVVLGGGNAKKLKGLPPDCRLGDNRLAFLGGFRLWQDFHQA
jgi:polyphosphate glucokinase